VRRLYIERRERERDQHIYIYIYIYIYRERERENIETLTYTRLCSPFRASSLLGGEDAAAELFVAVGAGKVRDTEVRFLVHIYI